MDASLARREFLKYTGAAAAAAALALPLVPEAAAAGEDPRAASTAPSAQLPQQHAAVPPVPHEQKLHIDFQSNNDGCEYYFLGNGLITAALQSVRSADAGTHCGVLLMSPEHFGRKASTFLYHPERGLRNSVFTLIVNGAACAPTPDSSKIVRAYPDAIPELHLDWRAGRCEVHEELYCPVSEPALVRTVTVRNTSAAAASVVGFISLYPNLMLFDEYSVDRTRKTLHAKGFSDMRMFSAEASRIGDRQLYFDLGAMAAGAAVTVTVVLTVDRTREEFEQRTLAVLRREASAYWSSAVQLHTNVAGYDHLFHSSQCSLRAAVARSGKMDGGIWQYNLEWVRDQSMAAAASSMMGRTDIAEALLRRILTRSVDEQGSTVEASRTRPPESMELDQNGELIYALWMHWVWSGSDALIREHWEKIRLVAEYVLQPVFRDPDIGLLKNTREYWERDASFGVKEGYELTYQMWNIIGLEKAAAIADLMNAPADAGRWLAASALMKRSFLTHPKFSLVDEGRFIKRRTADGTPQRIFEPANRKAMPPGMPMAVETVSYCDPDSASVLPIVFGLVDPKSALAQNSLRSMEQLWDQRWTGGGYGRYHVSSEPDSPGPWPFATVFIARASLEAGNDDRVVRALEWLLSVKGGASGAWMEFYGDRPVPPLPPVGIVVWTWAEIVMFFMHHVLGVRPSPAELVLRPRLFKGVDAIDATVPVHGRMLTIKIRRAKNEPRAVVNGKNVIFSNGTITLPFTAAAMSVEFYV